MEFNVYQNLSKRTINPINTTDLNILEASMGMSGEAGEVTDAIKKVYFQGHRLDIDEIVKEMGDCLWYIALLCTALNIEMEEVAEKNIDKLKVRYPDKFDIEKSVNRDV